MRSWQVIVPAVVVVAAAVGAYVVTHRSAPVATPRQTTAPPPEPEPEEITLQGKIRARQVVDVGPPLDGFIAAFLAEPGQEVYEGQLLAHISNEGLEVGEQLAQRALDTAQARLNSLESAMLAARLEASRVRAESSKVRTDFDRLERNSRRQKMLYSEGATPKMAMERVQREFEQAQGQFQALDEAARRAEDRVSQLIKDMDAARLTVSEKTAEVEEAKERAGQTELTSPVAGFVISRKGQAGEQVTRAMHDFFQIAVNLSDLEVVLDPEPPQQALLKAGQPALILTSEQSTEGVLGSVKSVSGKEAVVEFSNPDPTVRPGQNARVRIKLR